MTSARAAIPAPAAATSRAQLVQRQCACATMGGECEECAGKKRKKLQAKLRIGGANDPLEQEADRLADQVMTDRRPVEPRQPLPFTAIAQRSAEANSAGSEHAPAVVENAAAMAGAPLAEPLRQFFEPRFGHDFGHVRIHTDSDAGRAAQAIDARAYTVGDHVFFAPGQYAPTTNAGRRLLAHELSHVLQQNGVVRRACDKAVVGKRTVPVFFPQDPKLMDVFKGASVLKENAAEKEAIGLVQQALTDIGHPAGIWGPNKDGVDRNFKGDTRDAVKLFQADAGLGQSGEVDQETLRCLDEARSKRILPAKTGAAVKESDLRIDREGISRRDEDIQFARGDKTLDANDKKQIKTLATKFKDKPLTLAGFESEDEVVDFGEGLAADRIAAVEAEFSAAGQGDAKLRKGDPKPKSSGGALDYTKRRRVEVITPGGAATTRDCKTIPVGWTHPDFGPCDAATEKIVIDLIDRGVKLMDDALTTLKPGDATAEKAIADRFGDKKHLPAIKAKLSTWRDQLDKVVRDPAWHFCTNACHGACEGTGAYTDGQGAASDTFLCSAVMKKPANNDERDEEALILVHEAGHGALGTKDVAYDSTRLLGVIHKEFSLAEINTDSFVLLIQCLNGITINGMGCTLPPTSDSFPGLTGPEKSAAEETLAWLERWMDFVWQDVNNLYPAVIRAREGGAWKADDAGSKSTMDLLSKHFGLRRPEGSPAPTFREQTAVAAIHDRYQRMMRTTLKRTGREFSKSDKVPSAWNETAPKGLVVHPDFFKKSRRSQVRFLVELVVQAQPDISAGLVPAYVSFTDEDSKTWFNKP